jgi:EmrB/QacA subfamily drug resistance transporter
MQLPRNSPIVWLVAGAFFMENLDATVVVTAVPEMARSFHVDPVDINIGITAYVLTLAVLIPISGWMTDRFGARTIFGSAIAIFTVGSALCGFSTSLTAYTLARILQGVGGAMMVPVGRLVVLRATEKHHLISAIATITWPGLAAPVLGPPLGGFITYYFSWQWIFFLNIPLGLIALPIALRLVPPGRTETGKPFDGVGFLLTGAACVSTIYSIEVLSRGATAWHAALPWVVAALIFAPAAIVHARRHANPMLDFWGMRFRSFAVSIAGGSLFRVSNGALPFILPLLFQLQFQLNPVESGSLVLAVFAGNLLMKLGTTAVLRRFTFKTTMIVNGILNAAGIMGCALLTPNTPVVLTAALLFFSGMTRSMQFTTISTLAFADIPPDRMSAANSLTSIVLQATMGMGIAFGAALLRVGGLVHQDPPGSFSLFAFQMTFVVIGALTLFSVLDVLKLPSDAGNNIRLRKLAPQQAAEPKAAE